MNNKVRFGLGAVIIVGIVIALVFQSGSKESEFYERKIVFPETMPTNVQEDLSLQIKADIELIKQNNEDYNAWYDLGLAYKVLNDYEGARLVWEHAAEIRKESYAPRLALAELYGFFLHDEERAEYYYRDAITKDPKNSFSYFQFALYYRDVRNDLVKAREIAEEGATAIPGDADLSALVKSLTK